MELLGVLCYFGALLAFGNLLVDHNYDQQTQRFRIVAIWGIIFFLVWLGNRLTP
jgi:hypothetical protein